MDDVERVMSSVAKALGRIADVLEEGNVGQRAGETSLEAARLARQWQMHRPYVVGHAVAYVDRVVIECPDAATYERVVDDAGWFAEMCNRAKVPLTIKKV